MGRIALERRKRRTSRGEPAVAPSLAREVLKSPRRRTCTSGLPRARSSLAEPAARASRAMTRKTPLVSRSGAGNAASNPRLTGLVYRSVIELIVLAAWIGYILLIIQLDRRRMERWSRAHPEANYLEPEVSTVFWAGLIICGPLLLPMYFYNSRRSARGLLMGFG